MPVPFNDPVKPSANLAALPLPDVLLFCSFFFNWKPQIITNKWWTNSGSGLAARLWARFWAKGQPEAISLAYSLPNGDRHCCSSCLCCTKPTDTEKAPEQKTEAKRSAVDGGRSSSSLQSSRLPVRSRKAAGGGFWGRGRRCSRLMLISAASRRQSLGTAHQKSYGPRSHGP